MKILNLYAGVGGNRKLWPSHYHVTAVEYTPAIAEVYQGLYPDDTVIVGDAHEYLHDHAQEYDFVWSSPPCQSHSRMVKATRHNVRKYPDMKLYEEIIFLQHHYAGQWVVENVVPYYGALLSPRRIGRHLFWSNFDIVGVPDVPRPKDFINLANVAGKEALQDWLGIHYKGNIYYQGNHCPAQILRNAVHPLIGKAVIECAFPGETVDTKAMEQLNLIK